MTSTIRISKKLNQILPEAIAIGQYEKPVMTDAGFFVNARGHWWLSTDGEFPVDDCIDLTTSPESRERVIASENARLELAKKVLYGGTGHDGE